MDQTAEIEDLKRRLAAAEDKLRRKDELEAALQDSEERLRLAIDTGQMATWDWDLRTGEVAWNARHYLIQGYAVDEVAPSFDAWLAPVHSDDRDETLALLQKAREEKRIFVHDFRSLHADGEIVWCAARGQFLYNAHGLPYRMIGVMQDVTTRKRVEDALRESEEKYRELFQRIDEAFCIIEILFEGDKAVDYRFLDANQAFARHTGVADAVGRRMREIAPDHEEHWFDAYGEVARTGTPKRFRARASALGGRVHDVHAYRVGEPERRRVAIVFSDVTQRERDAEALRQSEARHRLLIESLAQALWETDADGVVVADSPSWRTYTGQTVDEWLGYGWLDAIHPDDRAFAEPQWREATAARGHVNAEFRLRAPDGGWRWTNVRAAPMLRADGGVEKWLGMNVDIDDRKRAEAALRESEERFRQFAASSSDALWVRNATTFAFEYVSPAVETVYGVTPASVLADDKLLNATIVPEERDLVSSRVERVARGEAIVQEYRIHRPTDRTFRWIKSTGFPLVEEGGRISHIGAIAQDVTEARLAVEHQGVLLAELQHRVRNIMAMARSIVVRTADRAADVQDYRDLLTGRLLALARVQALLTRAAHVAVDVGGIVRDEVGAQAQHEGQYALEGPYVKLSPKAAEVLTLAIHELATNALKYGALSAQGGKVTVRWTTFDKGRTRWLSFDWSEAGVAVQRTAPATPRRRGFGTELIEGRIPYELGGRGAVTIAPDGARCKLQFPLADGASALETGAPRCASVFGGTLDMRDEADLSGRRVLVVEDEYYLATDAARALQGAGAMVVGPVATEAAARSEVKDGPPDAVVLDINLGEGATFKLAEHLKDCGVPFVFLTGYDQAAIPSEFDGVERLEKPVQLRRIVGAVARLFAGAA